MKTLTITALILLTANGIICQSEIQSHYEQLAEVTSEEFNKATDRVYFAGDLEMNILSITDDTLCAYQCIEIEYETFGFPENTMFGFQLSDVNGVFDEDSPLTIGGSTIDSEGSTVSCAIWADETGTGYRLRIINFETGMWVEYDEDLTIYVVEYELVSSPGMLEAITENPITTFQWSNCPGNSIEGETNAQFTNGEVGQEYFINLIQDGCPTHSNCVEFESPVGISEFSTQEISIFPNPSNGEINISSMESLSDCSIQIYDTTGKMVYFDTVRSLQNENIDLPLSQGLYVVHIYSGNVMTYNEKLIISR